jgi:hypothetical protein
VGARGCTLVVCAADRVRVRLRLSITSRAVVGLAVVRRAQLNSGTALLLAQVPRERVASLLLSLALSSDARASTASQRPL